MRNNALLLLIVLLIGCSRSTAIFQESTMGDLAKVDLSSSLINPSTLMGYYVDSDENGHPFIADTLSFQRQDPLGFIGKDFSRFRIHFDTVMKSEDLQYTIMGVWDWPREKSKSSFKGTLKVDSIKKIDPLDEMKDINRKLHITEYGIIFASLELGSSFQPSPERWKGTAIFRYALVDGKYCYDTEGITDDGYCNNQYTGVMTTKEGTMICNWGDYRIPGSEKLDIGVAEFVPAGGKGWENYQKVNDDPILSARDKEWMQMPYNNWYSIDWDFERILELCHEKIKDGNILSHEECMSIMPMNRDQFWQFWDDDHSADNVNRWEGLVQNVMKRMEQGDFELTERFLTSCWKWADGWVAEYKWDVVYSLWKQYPKQLESIAERHGYLEALKEAIRILNEVE